MGKGQRMALYCGPLEFRFVTFDKVARGLVFAWRAETELENVIFVRFVCIRLRWPPIKVTESFLLTGEEKRGYRFGQNELER
jgi:hypothetical protein